jgi:hypothetical protein
MENNTEMVSLFEYLGRPVGSVLGRKIALEASKLRIPMSEREVSTPNYTGKIMLCPKSFLKTYFDNN